MSGTARILARLRQGPATAAELYGLHCIVHSRIAELRKQGHMIVCSRTPGLCGPEAYSYRIVGSLTERGRSEAARPIETGPTEPVAPLSVSDPLIPSGPEPQSSPGTTWLRDGSGASVHSGSKARPSGSEQLSLMVAA